MDRKIKNILNIVVVVVLVIWLLQVFGVLGSLDNVRIGHQSMPDQYPTAAVSEVAVTRQPGPQEPWVTL